MSDALAREHLREDSAFAEIIDVIGPLEIDDQPPFFPRFVKSIVRQQVSIEAADVLYERLKDQLTLDPAVVIESDQAVLTEAGLSRRKADTIHRVATAFTERDWSREQFEPLSDEAIIEELTSILGVGPWTAKMQLLFSLGRPDVFPIEDLGIRRGMEELIGGEVTRSAMIKRASPWRPHRSLASRYLWRFVDG